jgi:hypothetical protein
MLTRSKTRPDENNYSNPEDPGFRVLHKAIVVNKGDLKKLLDSTRKGGSIFNNSGDNDHLRKQCALNKNSKLFLQLQHLVYTEFPHLMAHDPVVLRSLPGCKAQKVHADYNIFDMKHHDSTVPYSLLLALQENTKLTLYPGSHRLSEKDNIEKFHEVQILLSPGDVVFFRGDLLHAGCAYDELNVRVHIFLDSETHVRQKNVTWLLEGHSDLASRCTA